MPSRTGVARALGALVAMTCAGCAFLGLGGAPDRGALMQGQGSLRESQSRMLDKQRLWQEYMKNPDTPEWHDQRQKIVMAQGDRVFDKGFDRVFDSMTVALATLECRVQNMERASGYISASAPALPPQQLEDLRLDGLRAYARSKGYSPDLIGKKTRRADAKSPQMVAAEDVDDMVDVDSMTSMMDRYGGAVTLSLVRQNATQTKVKIRFDKVYYPLQVLEYYRVVWAAVDKQIFLDQGLD